MLEEGVEVLRGRISIFLFVCLFVYLIGPVYR